MKFQTFSYHTLDEIRQAANGLSLTLPLSEVLRVLRQPVSAGPLRLANRIRHPAHGRLRRHPGWTARYAYPAALSPLCAWRAGLIWFEATAIRAGGPCKPTPTLSQQKNA